MAYNTFRDLYQPLAPGQVRVCTVTLNRNRIYCELSTVLRDQTAYHAVSYAWNWTGYGSSAKHTIFMHGVKHRVSHTLYAFLQAYVLTPARLPLWVDALCLDQFDEYEKAQQVLSMEAVYRSAELVTIWLGPSTEETIIAMDLALKLVEVLQSMSQKNTRARITDPEMQAILTSYDRRGQYLMYAGIGALCQRSWWTRSWVVQEASLCPNPPLVRCGNKFLLLQDFERLIYELEHHDLKDKCLRLADEEVGENGSNAFSALPDISNIRQYVHKHGSVDLLSVLQIVRTKDCTYDIDRLLGMLGILDPKYTEIVQLYHMNQYPSPSTLEDGTPNQSGGQDLLIAMSKANLMSDSSLITLSMARSRDHPQSLPSWCPNWCSPQPYAHFGWVESYHAGFAKGGIPDALVVTNDLNNIIRVLGYRVDVIEHVVDSSWTWDHKLFWTWEYGSERMTGPDGCAAKVLKWFDDFWRLAERKYRIGFIWDACWRTLIGNKMSDGSPDEVGDDWRRVAIALHEILRAWAANQSVDWTRYSGDSIREFTGFIEAAARGRRLFSTVGGRVGLGPPDTQPGDTVCIFLDARPVFILRFPLSSLRENWPLGTAELLGDAYLHGMTQGRMHNIPLTQYEIFDIL